MFLLLMAPLLIGANDPVIELPKPKPDAWLEFKAEPGRLLRLGTPDAMKPAKWVLIDDATADLEASDGGARGLFVAPTEGRYRLLVTVGADTYRIMVTVGKPQPEPPPPGPGPAPVPPRPDNPLLKSLQAAFDADPTQLDKRRGQLADLQELYTQAVPLASDPAVTSVSQVVIRLRDAARVLKIDGLDAVRKIIAAELQTAFPSDVPLTPDVREKLAELLTKIRDSLKAVKS